MDESTLELLYAARLAEKEQTLFYHALAAEAEAAGDAATAERLNELLADEQHHLSRITARLLELGEPVPDLRGHRAPAASLEGWEPVARARERSEVDRYTALLSRMLDPATEALVRETLRVETEHARALAGKWTEA
jgi:rubrerythrin